MDKQNSITIYNDLDQKRYFIESENDHLLVNGEKTENINLIGSSEDQIFTLDRVPAGRGFHWEKNISIQVVGSLDISNNNGYLFVINQINLESYLMCVATSEMSGNCPPALLEAQTIAARSWLVAAVEQKHLDLGLDACNDDCCQRYQGIGNLWDMEPKPYLRGVFDGGEKELPDLTDTTNFTEWLKNSHGCYCSNNYVNDEELKQYLGSVDEKGNYFRWEFTYSQNQILKMINEKTGQSFDHVLSVDPIERGFSGRIIKLKISGEVNNKPQEIFLESEYEIRSVFHPEFLYSSAFIINANSSINSPLDKITLKGAGWGHGVGLCQIGALGMALSGKSSKDILTHYFLSTTIKKLYD